MMSLNAAKENMEFDDIFLILLEDETPDYSFGIIKKIDNKRIGILRLYDIDNVNKRANIQIILEDYDEKALYYKQGVISLMKIAFKELNLEKICYQRIDKEVISNRIVQQMRFISEGFLRQQIFEDGKWHGINLRSVLKCEAERFHFKDEYARALCRDRLDFNWRDIRV